MEGIVGDNGGAGRGGGGRGCASVVVCFFPNLRG